MSIEAPWIEGNLQVFRNLHRKAELLRSGNPKHEKIRPLLIVMGGVMRGVAGGGASYCAN